MNHTTARIAGYAGVGLAGIATSCVLAAPALASLPPAPEGPIPGSEHQTLPPVSSDEHRTVSVHHGESTPASQASISSATNGTDWAALAGALAGGAVLGGVVVVGAAQVRRHHPHHPHPA